MVKKRLVLVNFKDYKESIGKNAVKLGKILDHKDVWLIVNAIDLKEVINSVKKSKVLVEHADSLEIGSYTGSISFPEVKKAKAYGVLLNHSERRITFDNIKKGISLAKKYKLISVICADNLKEAIKINKLKPNYITIEPPELISGNISVSESKPKLIKNASKKIKNLLVGAGVHNYNDVKSAVSLGAIGVLVSSAIVKSRNPREVLNDLLNGLK